MVYFCSCTRDDASAQSAYGDSDLAGDFSDGVTGVMVYCAAVARRAIFAAYRIADCADCGDDDLGSHAAADEIYAKLAKSG